MYICFKKKNHILNSFKFPGNLYQQMALKKIHEEEQEIIYIIFV